MGAQDSRNSHGRRTNGFVVLNPSERSRLIHSIAYAWGAIDFIPSPDSNFPDWRNITTINGKDAGIMLIPREDGKIRLYIELGAEEGLVDPETGRLDLSQFSAQRLLDVRLCICWPLRG